MLTSAPRRALSWTRRLYAHPYNRRHPFSAPVRLLRWFWLRRSTRPADRTFWGTRRIRCYPDADGSMWLLLNVVMDWDEFHFLDYYLRPADTFVDVGANLGIYTLWASQFIESSGRMVAFEPDPVNRQRLAQQLALNRLDRVRIEATALADRRGTLRFSQGTDMTNHLVTDGTGADRAIEVPADTFDDYCAAHGMTRVDFVKVDIEGAEPLFLRGATRMLAERRIGVLQLEFNQQVRARGFQETDIVDMLAMHGYRLFRFEPASRRLVERGHSPGRAHENLLALHDLDAVAARISDDTKRARRRVGSAGPLQRESAVQSVGQNAG